MRLASLKDREVYELFDGGKKVAQINLVKVGLGPVTEALAALEPRLKR